MTPTSLVSTPLSVLLEQFRSSAPTPGGGSAAALAGALGASLFVMVARLPKPRASRDADLAALKEVGDECTTLARQLQRLIDQDSAAYEQVMAAYRLPKNTDAENAARSSSIQMAMTVAINTPLDVMRACTQAMAHASTLAALGNPNASSDVRVGVELLRAAFRGARSNVEINLGSIKDQSYVEVVRTEMNRMDEA